jgi:outer membrane protein assembly factor BamA
MARTITIHRSITMLSLAGALAMVSCATPPFASSTSFEGRRISKVAIICPGPGTVDEERLRSLMTMKKGSVYSGHAADEDIKSLYESGLVDDVFIRVAPDHGQVRVKAVISTRSGIGAGPYVVIIGNSTFSDQRLFKEGFTKNPRGFLFYGTRVEIAGKRMEAYYHRMGFTGATVGLDVKRSKMWPLHALKDQEYYLRVDEGMQTAAPVKHHTPVRTWRNP